MLYPAVNNILFLFHLAYGIKCNCGEIAKCQSSKFGTLPLRSVSRGSIIHNSFRRKRDECHWWVVVIAQCTRFMRFLFSINFYISSLSLCSIWWDTGSGRVMVNTRIWTTNHLTRSSKTWISLSTKLHTRNAVYLLTEIAQMRLKQSNASDLVAQTHVLLYKS